MKRAYPLTAAGIEPVPMAGVKDIQPCKIAPLRPPVRLCTRTPVGRSSGPERSSSRRLDGVAVSRRASALSGGNAPQGGGASRAYTPRAMDGEVGLRRHVTVLRRAWRVIAGMVLVGLVVAFVVNATAPRLYDSRALINVGPVFDEANPDVNALLAAQRVAGTFASLAQTRQFLEQVRADAGLEQSVDELIGGVSAVAVPESLYISISYEDPDPVRVRSDGERHRGRHDQDRSHGERDRQRGSEAASPRRSRGPRRRARLAKDLAQPPGRRDRRAHGRARGRVRTRVPTGRGGRRSGRRRSRPSPRPRARSGGGRLEDGARRAGGARLARETDRAPQRRRFADHAHTGRARRRRLARQRSRGAVCRRRSLDRAGTP